jgi:hypothetical protein
MIDEPSIQHGELLVDLVSCLERSMEHVERTYPAVDHLSVHRGPPDDATLAHLRAQVEAHGSAALTEAFDRWWQLERSFRAANGRLHDLHELEAEAGPDYQARLGTRINAVREARAALEQEAAGLRRQVACEIDARGVR